MCKRCQKNPRNRNTMYCDDWWDDISHGGHNADRKLKEKALKRDREKNPAPRYGDE